MDDFYEFEKKSNMDSVAKSIKNNKWSMYFSDDKAMLLFAYSLFNRGILTGENNCFGGNLIHIDKQMLTDKGKLLEEIKKRNSKQ